MAPTAAPPPGSCSPGTGQGSVRVDAQDQLGGADMAGELLERLGHVLPHHGV